MGMLFGGWAREEEELVNSMFGGDWNRYRKYQEKEKNKGEFKFENPIKTDNSIESIYPMDIVCLFNESTGRATDDFLVDEIKEGQILGRYTDGRNNGVKEVYPHTDWKKLGSTFQE